MHTNKYCTTELLFSQLRDAVEATVDVKVVEGSWCLDFCPRLVARTKSFPDAGIVPFDHRGSIVMSDEGTIQLSRSVVTVESDGELQLIVEAGEPGSSAVVVSDTMRLTPKRMGTTDEYFSIGFCNMEVCVSWSLLLPFL